jgi:uncharacterized protein (DUF433 family)
MDSNWRDRIALDPAVHHGVPCIRDTRVPVSMIVGSIADGDTPEQILASWPQLWSDDLKTALKFAAEAVNNADFHSVPASRWSPVSRIKVDEDLPREIADLSTVAGHDPVTVMGQG